MAALDDVLPLLRCPACGAGLGRERGVVRCAAGHSFDVARQG
jgi:23S rRNA (guanine745-N1)-methyltransferase